MSLLDLAGQRGLVVGIANASSIAYGCAEAFHAAGAGIEITDLNAKAELYIRPPAENLASPIVPCDVATTMGFTALEGLPMGTRSGPIDPGVILYLLTERGMSVADVSDLLYRRSGLLDMSGISNDMRKLLASNARCDRRHREHSGTRTTRPMTVAGLERALGMLLFGAAFCERFFLNPSSATWEAGRPLSPIEVDALSRLSRAAIARFRESLDPHVRGRRKTDPRSQP